LWRRARAQAPRDLPARANDTRKIRTHVDQSHHSTPHLWSEDQRTSGLADSCPMRSNPGLDAERSDVTGGYLAAKQRSLVTRSTCSKLHSSEQLKPGVDRLRVCLLVILKVQVISSFAGSVLSWSLRDNVNIRAAGHCWATTAIGIFDITTHDA
jgi:hypothetical protein